MSQRKALIASISLTLLLALSAVGIRATMFDSQDDTSDTETASSLVATDNDELGDGDRYDNDRGDDNYDDDNDRDDDNSDDDDHDDDNGTEDSEHEEDDDDD